MPNLKIYADGQGAQALLQAPEVVLSDSRDILCRVLKVPVSACQIALLPVHGLPDQPAVNIELSILPAPYRTRGLLEDLARELRDLLSGATGLTVAVRISHLDAGTYVALK